MTIDEIKNILRRKAVIFETGGFRPTNEFGDNIHRDTGICRCLDELCNSPDERSPNE